MGAENKGRALAPFRFSFDGTHISDIAEGEEHDFGDCFAGLVAAGLIEPSEQPKQKARRPK
ncbi:hypothetical protein ACLMJV_06815 [Sinorhizobium meliloti]|uniref:hypothetical protein n=1 Tax=Rhizobium meliloti TaxID=382 RepID=UPI00398CCB9E